MLVHERRAPGFWQLLKCLPMPLNTAGTRLLGLAIGGVLIPASPAITLAMQLILLRLTMTPGYCSTALLTDGLMQWRTAAVAACLQYATLPILAAIPTAKSLLHDAGLLHGELSKGRCAESCVWLADCGALPCMVHLGWLRVFCCYAHAGPARLSSPR